MLPLILILVVAAGLGLLMIMAARQTRRRTSGDDIGYSPLLYYNVGSDHGDSSGPDCVDASGGGNASGGGDCGGGDGGGGGGGGD
jgi:hypothetical protein